MAEQSRPGRPRAPRILVVGLLAAMLVTGCTVVQVFNLSEISTRVRITLPDTPAGYIRSVDASGITETFSEYGGPVTVTVLPDEDYRRLLADLRERITTRLWEERATLSPSDVSLLVTRLSDIDRAVADLADDAGASCSVVVPDYGTVHAVVRWDEAGGGSGRWLLECSVTAADD